MGGYHVFDCGAHVVFLIVFSYQLNKDDDEKKLNPSLFSLFSLLTNKKKSMREGK